MSRIVENVESILQSFSETNSEFYTEYLESMKQYEETLKSGLTKKRESIIISNIDNIQPCIASYNSSSCPSYQ